MVHTPGAHPRRHPRRTNLHDLLSAALTVPRRGVDNKFVTRRQRWALPGLIVLPFVSSVGCVVLFGPVLVGMAPVFAALTALGALVIVATAVHQWTRSVVARSACDRRFRSRLSVRAVLADALGSQRSAVRLMPY